MAFCIGVIALVVRTDAAQPAGAKPVAPGFGDVGPSRTSLRVEQVDLRRPVDFQQVYTLGKVNAFGSDEVFLRVSGGITAVFPRSVYVKSRGGGVGALIPPGTTFYIGKLPEEFAPRAPAPEPSALRIDLSAPAGASRPRERARPVQPSGSPSMWENEDYRGARMGQILRRAMAVGRADGGRPAAR